MRQAIDAATRVIAHWQGVDAFAEALDALTDALNKRADTQAIPLIALTPLRHNALGSRRRRL